MLGLLALSLVVLIVWFPYELRVNNPMVDLRTAARRPVLLTNAASIFVAFGLYVNILASGQQLLAPGESGNGFGLSVTHVGLAMMPAGLTMVLLAPASGRMINRFGGRITLLVGAAVMCAAYVARVFMSGSVTEIVVGSSLVGIGGALSFAAMPTLIMANVPITESASANGLNSLMRALGGAVSSAVLAAVIASLSVTVARHEEPSTAAFEVIYWISAAMTLLALVLGAAIPSRRDQARSSAVAGAGAETVVHGQILTGSRSEGRQAAIVTVSRLDGQPVDWSRTDHDGRYSVALAGSGRFLLVANARGWTPRAELLDFQSGATELHLDLVDEFALSGTVVLDAEPMAGALVVLHGAAGEFVSTTRTREDGHFDLPLPQAGPYVVTAVDVDAQRARAVKLVVDARAAHVDIVL